MRARSLTLVLAVLIASASAEGAPQPASPAAGPFVTSVQLPGGVERLLREAGVPGMTDPAVAIPAFIRAVHVLPAKPRTDLALVFQRAARSGEAAVAIPLPLTAEWWTSAVLERPPQPGQLAAAILANRRAAFIYLGLVSLDDETLAYLSARPETIRAMGDRAAGAFGQWGRSIRIEHGRVQVPGDEGAAAVWQAVIGEAPSDPDRFIRALFSRDEGRAAYFYDLVAHLDPERQAFALAASAGDKRTARVKALYSTVAATRAILSDGDWLSVRHPFGPAALLRQVRADADGRMTAPASQALWEAAIGGNTPSCARVTAGGAQVDAAWLAERIEREFLETRGHWVAAVAFAQRVFANLPPGDLPAVCEATAAFSTHDGLLLVLERIGFRRPADYTTILRFAQRTWAGADRRAAVIRTAQVQGALQVLERAVSVQSLSTERARDLALSLAKLPSADALPAGAAGRWLRETLLPAACPGATSADACIVRLVSGGGATARAGPIVVWEDERYRVDPGAATAVRLERVRRVLKATRLDEALAVLEAGAVVAARQSPAADLERAATMIKATAPALTLSGPTLFGHPVAPARQALEAIVPGFAPDATDAVRTTTLTTLMTAGDLLLADALVSLAYAMAIGDPDDGVLMGGNPARGHLFDSTVGPATPAWHLPEEMQAVDRSWLVEGSALMLRTLYAKSWLRRLEIHDPGAAVRPDPQDVRAVGESVTAFGPFDLTDEGRDQIVAAIRRGRSRLAGLIASPPALWKAARAAGAGEWRCRAALWAARTPPDASGARPEPSSYFSLAELMWLGSPEAPPSTIDAWGVTTRPIDGGLGVRMPRTTTWENYQGPRGVAQLATQMADVHLAVAEALADMKLPAVLTPDVAAQAAWDVMASARMAHRDDWFALVHAAQSIPRDRFIDYVSALTAIGPLVPVR